MHICTAYWSTPAASMTKPTAWRGNAPVIRVALALIVLAAVLAHFGLPEMVVLP